MLTRVEQLGDGLRVGDVLGALKDARFARAAGRRASPVLDRASVRHRELGVGSLGRPAPGRLRTAGGRGGVTDPATGSVWPPPRVGHEHADRAAVLGLVPAGRISLAAPSCRTRTRGSRGRPPVDNCDQFGRPLRGHLGPLLTPRPGLQEQRADCIGADRASRLQFAAASAREC